MSKKVKPTRVYRMKVVPHRPIRSIFLWALGALAIVASLVLVRNYTIYDERKTLLSPEQTRMLRQQLADLTHENQVLQEQLTHYQVSADVDHQAVESVRQQVLQQEQQIGALERSVAVYRMMLSKDYRNPKGINYGTFTVTPNEQPNSFHLKLAVQKLSEGDNNFEGELRWLVVGRENEKEKKYSLHQLVPSQENEPGLTEIIPLSFKIFQNVEADVVLPEGFQPTRIELQVTSPRRDATRVDGQLEWPQTDVPTTTPNA
jgi:hypothetical protein